MSAYVEIIFDNSDDRFPTGKPELVLRRTIGLKKDEYSLDRKNATKSDVMNLLESAGFSRSNPYYIVPQGRVTTLTNMKDSERLNLLKEVAGTQVYEARRTESLKIMNETNNKRSKIDELLDYINERLGELEEEKNELRSFQEKDREERCLKYTIYHREQDEVNAALAQLQEQREARVDQTDENREKFMQGEKDLAQTNKEIAELRQQMEFLKVDKKQLDDERRDAARARAQVELQVKGLTDGQAAAQQSKARHDEALRTLQQTIQEREKELNQLLPQFNGQKKQEETAKGQLEDAEAARQRLYAKQGRNSRFKNQDQRDAWLRKEIADGYTSLGQVKAVRIQTDEDINDLGEDIEKVESEVGQLREQLDGRGDAAQTIDQEVQKAGEERDGLMDQRKCVTLYYEYLLQLT
jgi:structural maintenance of chromosome 3 (chondroitin sulfate proteoglycan 6)